MKLTLLATFGDLGIVEMKSGNLRFAWCPTHRERGKVVHPIYTRMTQEWTDRFMKALAAPTSQDEIDVRDKKFGHLFNGIGSNRFSYEWGPTLVRFGCCYVRDATLEKLRRWVQKNVEI